MSYITSLDEYTDKQLREEMQRRIASREMGVCSYCGRHSDTPECKFPDRHQQAKPTPLPVVDVSCIYRGWTIVRKDKEWLAKRGKSCMWESSEEALRRVIDLREGT